MSKQTNRSQTKAERRREERRLRQEAERRAARQKRLWIGGIIIAVVLVIAGVAAYLFNTAATNARSVTQATPSPTSAQSTPAATPASSSGLPQIDNIECNSSEQLNYHVHAHLSLYINGKMVPVPANIGISYEQGCYYWLHTHDTSGVIHIEAPSQSKFVLGTFFKEWREQFSQLGYPQQLSQTSGWVAYVNGTRYNGNFQDIELQPHTLITLAYNTPDVTPDTVYNWGDL